MPTSTQEIQSHFIQLNDTNLKLHYLESGLRHKSDKVILLLHGWPTSSYLYRKMMVPLAKFHRVIAIDLPGFGQSDKNLEDSFSFPYYANAIQTFIEQKNIQKVHLVVHDLGGPIGLWWAQKHRKVVASYVILDTIVFPDFSWGVKLFMFMTMLPFVKKWLSSPSGIAFAMRFGIYNKAVLTPEVMAAYQAPFQDKMARKVLLRSVQRLNPKGFKDISESLKDITQSTSLIYAENDKILPKAKETMERISAILPQASMHSIPECGHFMQEEKPDEIVKIMLRFYAGLLDK